MKNEENQVSIFDSGLGSNTYEQSLSFDKLKSELTKFGLTSNQSKVYIYLGKFGSKTAPEVCRTLKLPRTETYHLLTALQNKGIVSATFQHPIKFLALPLNKAIWVLVNAEKERVNTLEKQEQTMVELWNNIPEFSTDSDEPKDDKFQMLQGSSQIHGKLKEMIADAKTEFSVLGSEKDYLKFYHADFLKPLDNSKIELKFLTSSSERTLYIFDEVERNNVRKISDKVPDNLCFILKDNNELLFFTKNASHTSQQLTAMWTDSTPMINSMKMLFNHVWSKSKNIHL